MCADQDCNNFLHVILDQDTIILGPNLTVEYNRNHFSGQQASRLTKTREFVINTVGDTLVLTSHSKHFWVRWSDALQIGVSGAGSE